MQKKRTAWKNQMTGREKRNYLIAEGLCVAGFIVLLILLRHIIDRIGFSDAGIIAFQVRPTIFFAVPLPLFLLFSAGIHIEAARKAGKPIFTRQTEKVWYSPEQICRKRRRRCVWWACLVISAAMFLLGFFGRECLTEDNCIRVYSPFNQLSAEYTSRDVASMEIATDSKHNKFHSSLCYSVNLTMNDGSSFYWSNKEFRCHGSADDDETILRYMLELKELLSDKPTTVQEQIKREKLVAALKLNETVQALLDELLRE